MDEIINKLEPPIDDSKKKVKYGLLLMLAEAFVMVMDRTRLVAGGIIMGYAALQLLLDVVLPKKATGNMKRSCSNMKYRSRKNSNSLLR